MSEAIPHTPVEEGELPAQFASWVEMIDANHHASNNRVNPSAAFAPLTKPLAESTVALVSTAGVHLDDQEPFHVATTAGDASYRLIPHDADASRLRFTHTHYDTSSAEVDPNVVFPRAALDDAVASGRIGAASATHVGMMGFNPDPTEVAEESGPAVAKVLAETGADVAILVPG